MLRILVAAAAILGALSVVNASADGGRFYEVSPADLAGPPGSLIRVEGLPHVELTRAMAYRILYRSTGLRGEPIAVSGLAVVPFRAPPAAGWPIVAWAHGTTGIVPKCAPSLRPEPIKGIPGINEIISGDFVLAATDYPGLGAGTIHPYLVGVSEGRAVLDSVRAVRALQGARAGNRIALIGHSQGGHAVLWATQIWRRYAPELELVGTAALAPATELGHLFSDDIHRLAGRILSALVMGSWSSPGIYGAPLDLILPQSEDGAIARIADNCIDQLAGELGDLRANKRIPADFLKASPTEVEPWRSLVAANRPAVDPSGVPYYIGQGTADTTVDPPVTENFVERMCAAGSVVRLEMFPGKTHRSVRKAAAPAAVAWIRDRFAGVPAPDTCRRWLSR
ncbi:MAG TPA: lipase family protein [Bauldia sp.]|nr:lipase family protein [Bauldia sp.]